MIRCRVMARREPIHVTILRAIEKRCGGIFWPSTGSKDV